MVFVPILTVAFVLFIGGAMLARAERRRSITRTVVRQMAMVTSQNIPLGTGLMLAGQSERRKAGKILCRIADLVSQGSTLSEALASGYPSCSGLIKSVVHAAERGGRLSAALSLLTRELDDQTQRRTKIMPLAIVYAMFLLLVLLLVWTACTIVIMPKFRAISEDFGVRLPTITQGVMSAGVWLQSPSVVLGWFGVVLIVVWTVRGIARLCRRGPREIRRQSPREIRRRIAERIRQSTRGDILIGSLLILLVLVVVFQLVGFVLPALSEIFELEHKMQRSPISVLRICYENPSVPLSVLGVLLTLPLLWRWATRPRRFDRPWWSSQMADRIRWATPGLGRLETASSLATAASLLRLFTGAGMTLEQAADLAAQTDLNTVIRRRIRRFAERLRAGTAPPSAAEQAGLGAVFVTALRNGRHGQGLDASLRFVAEYYRSITSRLWVVIQSVFWPIVTLCMAVLIGTFAVAMFLPLVALIDAVMGSV